VSARSDLEIMISIISHILAVQRNGKIAELEALLNENSIQTLKAWD